MDRATPPPPPHTRAMEPSGTRDDVEKAAMDRYTPPPPHTRAMEPSGTRDDVSTLVHNLVD